MKQHSVFPQQTANSPSPLFAQMLRENPNRALAWRRAAEYMPDEQERLYCLERALSLDPTDTPVQTELRMLQHSHSEVRRNAITPFWLSVRHLIHSVFGA